MDPGSAQVKDVWRRTLMVAVASGIALGGLMLRLGATHDSQSEFSMSDGTLDYVFFLKLFALWFLIGALVGAAVFALYKLLRRVIGQP